MDNPVQQILAKSVLRLLRPLVRILLRNGMAYDSFSSLAKQVYVKVAFDDFAPDGKKQTISRVSALTGLTRKEVKRLHELPRSEAVEVRQRYNRATRVIGGWLHDSRFKDKDGQIADLYLDETTPSFITLVKDYSGDIPTKAMLSTLEKAGSVKVEDGKVILVKHAYIPGNDSTEKLNILGTDVAELTATIDHNLEQPEHPHFQRKASNKAVAAESLDEFRALMGKKSMDLLEELDAWMSAHEVENKEQPSEQTRQVSVGIYYYEDSSGGNEDEQH
ncbi:MAG TPA: hypothetical protein EYH06_08720 [Chromatiales bacterium]|nr:hypothetical protein [Thiotrichales bacterium]HIP68658.1 hypothetical protein [Chromatiales bacterium]